MVHKITKFDYNTITDKATKEISPNVFCLIILSDILTEYTINKYIESRRN